MSVSKKTLKGMVDAIHAQPELIGVVVGLYDDLQCSVADPGAAVTKAYSQISVVIEIVEDGEASVVPTVPTDAPQPPRSITNSSPVWTELKGAGLNCGFAVVAGVGVLGSAAGEVPTAGTSTFLLVASWAGFVTSGIQCVNGVVRSVEAYKNPTALARWDQSTAYKWSFLIVDGIGVAAALVTLPMALKNLYGILQRSGGLMSAEALAKLGREAKAKEIEKALAAARRNAQSAAELDKALNEAVSAKALRRIAAGSAVVAARNSAAISQVISNETTRRLTRAILDVISAVDSPIASAFPSSSVGSASGSVNASFGYVIHVVGMDGG